MKKFSVVLSLLAILLIQNLKAQIFDPIKWEFEKESITEDKFRLKFIATIEEGWHLYSQNLPSEDGPIATKFYFNENSAINLLGEVQEPKPITEWDPNFEMNLNYFERTVTFIQEVKLNADASTLEGEFEFMICDSEKCLPPDYIPFSFDLKKLALADSKDESNLNKEIEEITVEETNQIYEPVNWKVSHSKKENGTYDISIKASIDEGWHVYTLELPEGDGPIPTEVVFDESKDYSAIGKLIVNGQVHTNYDPNFMMDLSYYETEVEFIQNIKVNTSEAKVTGEVYYMTCNDQMCLPPESVPINILLEGEQAQKANDKVLASGADEIKGEGSILGIFFLSFLGGFAALLTPCVFPMIPLTVSFFTKQSKTKAKGISNALLYGISIIGIYVLLGFGVTTIFGADALNALSTNVYFNLIFFILLVVFAISFFGAFEITLPSSWINKADQASYKGGLIGIFFMAFTLSLVSFSCTGPIIGTLLVQAAVNGGIIGPLVGMFGFSLALALPFALFAAFPGWLNSMPKSGGWLNSVKVTLGFLELALALKFLSNADLVLQAGYLKRELFLTLWIVIFGCMSLYLLGFIRLPHDSETKHLPIPRLFFAILSLVFTIYLIPGLWGAPLKIISGFPPPMFYSESPNGFGPKATGIITSGDVEHISNAEHCPHGLNCFHDYEEGLAYAKEVGKPVMLDFTGWACVNCRKMEDQVWSDPKVLNSLSNDVVLISLYVDDKNNLPESEQKEVTIGTKKKTLKTIGNKWSYMQASRFGTNSQPYYVILDHNENQLHESAAYDPDIPKFLDWLKRGKEKFDKGS